MPTKMPPDQEPNWENHVHQLGQELSGHLKKVKSKYQELDENQKKALFAGLAGLTALLAGKHMVKKHNKKKAEKAKKEKK